MRRLTSLGAVVLLALVAACGNGTNESATTPSASASATPDIAASKLKPAHDFSLRTFDGDTFTLSEHFGELPVVLNFWAPW
ncbi:MAG: TlpA family protein disulfide reductase [Actinomycetota bacterium]